MMNIKKVIANIGAGLSVGGIGLYWIYRNVFGRVNEKDNLENAMFQGKQYEPYEDMIRDGMEKAGKMQFQRIFIEARDEITLSGKYYHMKDQAPVILFFHGYHGNALRDGNGILQYAGEMGYNVLLADQRGHGKSGGKAITFGIKERFDCMDWINYMNRRFGEETPIILAGISMGASTILMTADMGLPANVKGILADCPFSSPKDILKEVIKQMKFPVDITYAAVRLGGKIFGGFDVEEHSAVDAMRNCQIPVLFIHGDEDYFVPGQMSQDCYDACISDRKRLVFVKGAAHGMSYCVDSELYLKEVGDFLNLVLN